MSELFNRPLSLRVRKLWTVFARLRLDPGSVPIIALSVNKRRPTGFGGFIYFFILHFYRPTVKFIVIEAKGIIIIGHRNPLRKKYKSKT